MVSDKENPSAPKNVAETPSDGQDSADKGLDAAGGSPAPEIPQQPLKLETQQILEKELGLAKVCDFVAHESLDLIYQRKLIETYKKDLAGPLFGIGQPVEELDGQRQYLKEEYIERRIPELIDGILTYAEDLAASKGIKESMQKRLGKISLGVMSSIMIGMFVIMGLVPQYSSYIMFPMIFLICFLPQFLRNSFMKKWNLFKATNQEAVNKSQKENVDELMAYAQDLLNDIRERLLANRVPLQAIQFSLFSKDYENVQFMGEQNVRGAKSYVFTFKYPPGMEPFEMPSMPGVSARLPSAAVPEDDENDLFVVLRSPTFDADGVLENFQIDYPAKDEYVVIEALLNNSEFIAVENPRSVIPSFNSNARIKCQCGEPVVFTELKTIRSIDDDSEFYMALSEKCQCGKNPFVVFKAPKKQELVEELKEIFD